MTNIEATRISRDLRVWLAQYNKFWAHPTIESTAMKTKQNKN
jgi:hypothetical protein